MGLACQCFVLSLICERVHDFHQLYVYGDVMDTLSKAAFRKQAKAVRNRMQNRDEKSIELIRQFPLYQLPQHHLSGAAFAGFWPLGDEIDLRPLMTALVEQGKRVCLPLTGPAGTALTFKDWTPTTAMDKGRYGTREPKGRHTVSPRFIFVPLLAFDMSGGRLGYGGGYYDRTIEALRGMGREVFTCGVGFDAQKTGHIPMEAHDVRLDAILTPKGFHVF